MSLLLSVVNASAQSYAENFATAEASGTTLSALPAGWDVIGDISDLSLITTVADLHGGSGKSLRYPYPGNTTYVVTPAVSGTVTFWVKCTTTNSTFSGEVAVYNCTDEDGTLKAADQIGMTEKAVGGEGWKQVTMELDGAAKRRLAILFSCMVFSDFAATNDGTDDFVARERLGITAFSLTSAQSVTCGEDNKFDASFSVKVKNIGNVDLAADKVKVSLVSADGSKVYGELKATDALAKGEETELTLNASIAADEGSATYSFKAREELGQTLSAATATVKVTAYESKFALKTKSGYSWATVSESDTFDFGFATAAVSKEFRIDNDGTKPLSVSLISVPEGFAVSESAFVVDGKKTQTFTVTFAATTPGAYAGKVVVAHDLGEASFSVSGTQVDPEKFFENFESRAVPDAWGNDGWGIMTASNNYYVQRYDTKNVLGTLTTPKLTVAEDEQMLFQARRVYAGTPATLSVSYSADGTDWTELQSCGDDIKTINFTTIAVSGVPAGNYYVRFTGNKVCIDNVMGFSLCDDAPLLRLLGSDGKAAPLTYDFGMQTADTELSLRVFNPGTGTLHAQLATTGDYTVSCTTVDVAAGESVAVTLTMLAKPYGAKDGSLTVKADENQQLTIALSGQSRDPEALYVDFQDKQMPTGWTAESCTVTKESYYSSNYVAQLDSWEDDVTPSLTTPLLAIAAGETMTFSARSSSTLYTPSLKIATSVDGQTWTEAADYTSQLTTTFAQFTVSGLEAGKHYVRFEGNHVWLDDIIGFRMATDARTFAEGEVYTLCLPVALSEAEAAEAGHFYAFTGVEDDALLFTQTKECQAYVPYIFCAGAQANALFDGMNSWTVDEERATSTTVDGVSFVGVVKRQRVTADDSQTFYGYRAADGAFGSFHTTMVDAYCAYIAAPASTAESRQLRLIADTATAISAAPATRQSATVYDLSGRQCLPEGQLKPGIYVKNGKKFVVKK